MSSKLQIINAAFLLLGAEPVTNLGSSARQDVINAEALYDIYYLSLLTRTSWRFALKQYTLSQVNDFPEITGYNYAYQLPNDYLQIYSLDPMDRYEIYGTLLYTNLNPTALKLYYTHKVSEANLPVYYVEFLVEKFAELFALMITQEAELAQLWGMSAKEKLNRAMTLDNQQQPSLSILSNPIGSAKMGYGVGFYGI